MLRHLSRFLTLRWLALAALLLLALIAGSLYWAIHNIPLLLHIAGKATGQPIHVEQADLDTPDSLQLTHLSIGDFARIEKVDLRWTLRGLLNSQIEEIRIHGARIWLNELEKAPHEDKTSASSSGLPFKVKKLIISNTTLIADNLGVGLPAVPIHLAHVPPAIVLTDVTLGAAATEPSAHKIQTATLHDFTIYSPYDPSAKVIQFESITLRFSLAGIQQQKLHTLAMEKPTLYIGPDLFWFADEIQKRQSSGSTPGSGDTDTPPHDGKSEEPTTPWHIDHFEINGGTLALSTYGEPLTRIPGTFHVAPTPLTLGDFSQLHLNVKFTTDIPLLEYPAYSLTLDDIRGRLDFNLPLQKADTQNIVRTFEIGTLTWKGISFGTPSNPVWVSLTFDRNAIFGHFGGPMPSTHRATPGYVNGGFSFHLDNHMRWLGWASATECDLTPITHILIPEYLTMDGHLSGSLKVRGQRREILGLGGTLNLDDEGTLTITATDELLQRLPSSWPLYKQDLTRATIEAFHLYDYTSGHCEFTYSPPGSFLRLQLQGLQGARHFDIRWDEKRGFPGPILIPVP